MTDEDITIDEKRVYATKEAATAVFVATGVGVAHVAVSADIVGEFTLVRRGVANDVATADGRLAVATPADVLVGSDDEFVETGFGPADAVGYSDGLVAAGDGRVARYDDGWTTLCEVDAVRAIDGDLLATASGVRRLDGTHVGLDAATDVSTASTPLAATDSGLYVLANGWMKALDGAFRVVSAERQSDVESPDEGDYGGRAHAGTADAVYERNDAATEWEEIELPVSGGVADIGYGEATYAVTEDGQFLSNAGDGWRQRSLGLPDVSSIAVL